MEKLINMYSFHGIHGILDNAMGGFDEVGARGLSSSSIFDQLIFFHRHTIPLVRC